VLRDYLGDRAWTRETLSGLRSADLLAVKTCGRSTVEEIDAPPGNSKLVEAAYAAIRAARLPKLAVRDRERLMVEIVKLVQAEKRTG